AAAGPGAAAAPRAGARLPARDGPEHGRAVRAARGRAARRRRPAAAPATAAAGPAAEPAARPAGEHHRRLGPQPPGGNRRRHGQERLLRGKRAVSRQAGFTLLEIMVAVLIMAILLTFTFQAYRGIEGSYQRVGNSTSRDRAARVVLDRLERELVGTVL